MKLLPRTPLVVLSTLAGFSLALALIAAPSESQSTAARPKGPYKVLIRCKKTMNKKDWENLPNKLEQAGNAKTDYYFEYVDDNQVAQKPIGTLKPCSCDCTDIGTRPNTNV